MAAFLTGALTAIVIAAGTLYALERGTVTEVDRFADRAVTVGEQTYVQH